MIIKNCFGTGIQWQIFFVKRQLTKKLENHSLILGDLTNQNSFWKCKVTWLFCDCHAVIIRLMSDISKMDSEFFLISLFLLPIFGITWQTPNWWCNNWTSEEMNLMRWWKWTSNALNSVLFWKMVELTLQQWSWISNGSPKTWARSILVAAVKVFLTPTATWENFLDSSKTPKTIH